jgi:hypothetical protein
MSESKLATFRTDSDTWENFQTKAKLNGTNASALLQRFVRDYLDDKLDSRIDSPAASNVDIKSMIEAAVNSRLILIESEVHGLRTDRHIEKTDGLLIEKLQTDLAIAHHRIDDLDKKIATLTDEATAPAKTPVIDSPVESDALPIIGAIEALPAPDVLPSNEADTAAPESLELNQRQICDRFDIDYKNLSKKAGTANMTSDAYIMHIAKEHGEIWEKAASKGSTKLWKLIETVTP